MEYTYSGFENRISAEHLQKGETVKVIRIGNRRWNLVLDNGIIVQLPEHNMIDAWNNLDKILSIDGVEINVKIIPTHLQRLVNSNHL